MLGILLRLRLPAGVRCGWWCVHLLAGDLWEVSTSDRRRFSIIIAIRSLASQQLWWLSNVYGPSSNSSSEKTAFLQELRDIRAACAGPWLVCGDFNLITRRLTRTAAGFTAGSCAPSGIR